MWICKQHTMLINLFLSALHLPIFCHLFRLQSPHAKQGNLMSFTPVTSSSSSWGDPEAFPGQMGYVIPPAVTESALWSSSHQACVEYLIRRHQVPKPPQLASFNMKEEGWEFLLISELSLIPHSCWWAVRGKLISSSWIHDLIITTQTPWMELKVGEGGEHINLELLLLLPASPPVSFTSQSSLLICPSPFSTLTEDCEILFHTVRELSG